MNALHLYQDKMNKEKKDNPCLAGLRRPKSFGDGMQAGRSLRTNTSGEK